MNMYNRTVALSLALMAAVALPASAADKEQRQMMADLRILQEQSQQLQNLIVSLNEALRAVNQRLDAQVDADRHTLADEKLAIDNLANELRVLREKADDTNVRVGSINQELDALRQSVTALSTTLRSSTVTDPGATPPASGDAPAPTPPQDTTDAAPAATPALSVGTSPQRLLDGAMADYYGGQYDLAVLGFESYIKSFPQSPQADYAQYHVGMSLFNDAKYDRAAEAFDAVIKNYPRSALLADSYVKMGVALKNLKQNDRAREAFNYVITNHSDSTAATIARQQLEGLGQP